MSKMTEVEKVVFDTHSDKDLSELLELFDDRDVFFKDELRSLFQSKNNGYDTIEKLKDAENQSIQRVKERINSSYPNTLS